MWDDLYRLAQIVATPLLIDDGLVYTPCGHTVGACGLYACETLVVAEVEVGLHTVGGDVALSVFVRIERTGVDVDVRVKLLDSNLVATSL